jgi:hypothetical protein
VTRQTHGGPVAPAHRDRVERQRARGLADLKAKAARATREAHVLRHVDKLERDVRAKRDEFAYRRYLGAA